MANLGDIFAAVGGHPVNRPQLSAFVAQSQELNGLRSAQTEEAMETARKSQLEAESAQTKQQALQGMERAYVATGMDPARAHQRALEDMAGLDAQKSAEADAIDQKMRLTQVVNDPSTSASDRFMAAQALAAVEGKGLLPSVVQQPNEGQMVPGAPPLGPTIQTPLGQAQTNAANSLSALHDMQTTNPELFHQISSTLDPASAQEVAEFIRQNPSLAGNMRSLLMGGGASVVHAFLHPDTATAAPPANGITPAPGVSLKEQADIRHDFAGGLAARQSTALNTMFQHSQLFDQIADQLQNGNFTPTNAIAQAYQRIMGSPVPSNLGIAASFLGREAVRATVNSGAGTGQERELTVDASSSPDALHGAAQTLRSLAAGQVHSLELRAQRGGVDMSQLLAPEAAAAFGFKPAGAAPAPAAAGGGPPQTSAAPAPAAPAVASPPAGGTPPPLGSVAPVATPVVAPPPPVNPGTQQQGVNPGGPQKVLHFDAQGNWIH